MRIALVSTCALATPPLAYGGTELVVAELGKGLHQLGHEVVTYATGNSSPAGTLRSLYAEPIWPPDDLAEQRHAAFAFRDLRERDFDVVHVHHASAIPFHFSTAAACVATVHHDRVPRMNQHYAAYPEVSFVAISRRQAELSPEVGFAGVIHHGLDPSHYPAGAGDGGYAAYLGRFAMAKGTHVALDVADKAGVPLHMGGAPHAADDAQAYFAQEIRPRFDRMKDGFVWHGEVGVERKLDLLRKARALLFPIDWEEPFGLVMIESMLVGTPVLAYRRGSTPEVVEDELTGYLVDGPEEMAERLRGIDRFDRARCRARAVERWSNLRMARQYAELYEQLIDQPTQRHRLSTSAQTSGAMDHGAAAGD